MRAVYVDAAGAIRDGTLVRTWTREVYTSEQRSDQVGVMYFSANTLMSYDCAGRTFAALFKVFYGGDGTELRRIALDAVEIPALAAPGSLQEALLERACSAQAKPGRKDENAADQLVKVAAADTTIKPTAVSASKEAASQETKPDAAKKSDDAAKAPTSTTKSELQAAAKPEASAGKLAAVDAKEPGKAKAAAPDPPVARSAAQHAAIPARTNPPAAGRPAQPVRLAAYEPRRSKAARAAVKPEPPTPAEVHWTYTGPTGAENWGKLNPEFAACGNGKRQSPIDIKDGAKLELEEIKFDYKPAALRVVDNGHTVQVNYEEGSNISVAGERYELKQFHFHKPAEERIGGKAYDMVAHLVHHSADGRLAVVAVVFEAGPFQNAFIRSLWPHLPLEQGREIAPLGVNIDVNQLLPENRAYYAFMGSLTTPPCTEGVLWLVLKAPVPITAEQVGVFGKLYAMNARPVQPSYGRLIKESN